MANDERYTDIGSLQIKIMRILWQRGDGTVYEVLEDFPASDKPAYTTVLHVLRTLERRGLVAHIKESRQHRFRPVVQEDQVEAGAVHSLVSRLFGGSAQRLVATLLQSEPIDAGELDHIKRLIAEREAELKSGSGSR